MTDGCQQSRVMTTEDWMAAHISHGQPAKIPNEHQPPKGTYTIYTLTCLCGARHVITEDATNEPTPTN